MPNELYNIKEGQNIYDVALSKYGNVEALIDIVDLNQITDLDNFVTGILVNPEDNFVTRNLNKYEIYSGSELVVFDEVFVPQIPTIAQPKRCFTFDGIDDNLYFDNDGSFNFSNGVTDKPFSITAWINMSDSTNFIILDISSQYILTTNGQDRLRFAIFDSVNSSRLQSQTLPLTAYEGQWLFIAATYDGNSSPSGNSLKVYVYDNQANLIFQDSSYTDVGGVYVSMSTLLTRMYIGSNTSIHSNGKIFDVRIHSRELSENEIFETGFGDSVFILDSEILWLKSDEVNGTNGNIVYDSSGNGHQGILENGNSTFYYEGEDIPYSFQNAVGYSIYNETELIPRDESDITKDVLDNPLQFLGVLV